MTIFNFHTPKKIIYGQGSVLATGAQAKAYGKKALIVTGRSSTKKSGALDALVQSLSESQVESVIFDQVESDPSVITVEKGAALCHEIQPDMIIGIGGGSPLDAAKVINLLYKNGGRVDEYLQEKAITPLLPFLAIPTTAGTGSEVTKFSVITDTETKIKMVIPGVYMIPDIAILDPEITVTMPPDVTAATALDALTHAIEAYTSKLKQPLSDGFALSAISKISQSLLSAVREPENLEAREQLLIGQMEAGLAFSNASVGLVHSMSRPLGAHFGVPHGLANALLLPHVMSYNLDHAIERYAEVAEALGKKTEGMTSEQAAKEAVNHVENLFLHTGLPVCLKDIGIKEDKIPVMAKDALESGSTNNNPKMPSLDDIIAIYNKAMEL